MKVLMVGDIVASAGRDIFARVVRRMREGGEVDFVVANAENSAGGRGITGPLAEELFKAEADVITLGDHTWDQKDVRGYLGTESRILRPLNFAPGCPGSGFVTIETGFGKVTVVNLIGRVFMNHYDCPFRAVDGLLQKLAGSMVLVDFHAEATAEKIVMGRYLDGRVSAVAGTHTHVQTSDETVLQGGTAYITDLGMTGPKDSSLGRDLEQVTGMMLTGMPSPFKAAKGQAVLEGVVVEIDHNTRKAKSIRRIREVESDERGQKDL